MISTYRLDYRCRTQARWCIGRVLVSTTDLLPFLLHVFLNVNNIEFIYLISKKYSVMVLSIICCFKEGRCVKQQNEL